MRNYQNFIGGEWVNAVRGKRFSNVNPADTRESIADYPQSGSDEGKQAIAAAKTDKEVSPGSVRKKVTFCFARGELLAQPSRFR